VVDRRTAATAIIAVLAVLALGISAATLDSATTTDRSSGVGSGPVDGQTGAGDGDNSGIDLSEQSSGETSINLSICVDFLKTLEAQLVLLLFVALLFGAIYRTTQSFILSGMTLVSLLFPFVFVYLVLISCGQQPTEVAISMSRSAVNQTGLMSGGGSAGSGGEGDPSVTPTSILAVLLFVAIAGSVGLLIYSTGDDEDELADEEPEIPPAERQAAVGAVAREAADRLEADADVENEVYRAWREMTTHLRVDHPKASTPAEFAAAAVEAGMDRADVTELTQVFEEVRYGGEEATEDREQRAIRALRNIEETYADLDSDADAETGADLDSDADAETGADLDSDADAETGADLDSDGGDTR
jgi:hypothetical protein